MDLNPNVKIKPMGPGEIATTVGVATPQPGSDDPPGVALMIEVPVGTFMFVLSAEQADWVGQRLMLSAKNVQEEQAKSDLGAKPKIIIPGMQIPPDLMPGRNGSRDN